MSQIKKCIKALWIPLLCGLIVFLIFRFLLIIGYVPSASMEPTIPTGTYILGSRIYGELQRGDIVIFKLDGKMLVKRIVGLPGDTLHVDSGTSRLLIVPDDHYYLTGDNSEKSIDSRRWEEPFIHENDIIAALLSV